MIAAGDGWELRLGRWQDVLGDVVADALIFDAPYSGTTHASKARRNDGSSADGCAPGYGSLTPDDVRAIVDHWSPRCRGWMVSITDDVLAPVWRAAYRSAGRYAFCAIPCVVTGMTWRVRRPQERRSQGRPGQGKPQWLPDALVRDYTRPDDLVVDPFAGWATTLLAAVGNGRRAIGEAFDKAVAVMNGPLPRGSPEWRRAEPHSIRSTRVPTPISAYLGEPRRECRPTSRLRQGCSGRSRA